MIDDIMRAPTPHEIAAAHQREIERVHAFCGPVVGREGHQAFWAREIKAALRKLYR